MRIVQILLPDASWYERKSQRADFAALSAHHEVSVSGPEEAQQRLGDVAHVYAGSAIPAAPFVGFATPYVASSALQVSRWSLRKPEPPRAVVTPENLPEAVEDAWFERGGSWRAADREPSASAPFRVASFFRESTRNAVEQAVTRIHRFRDDVVWDVFTTPPTPDDLAAVDLWVDPSVEEKDYDGFVAEALVIGLPVVASRTPVNASRLEQGRTGTLVPPNDPNEMTHAILNALFKRERTAEKLVAAQQTASKFRVRQRIRVLTRMYENLIQ